MKLQSHISSLIGIYIVGSVGAKSPVAEEDLLLCRHACVPEEGLRSKGSKNKKKRPKGFFFSFKYKLLFFVDGLKEGAFCDAVTDLFVRRSQGSSVWSLNRF